MRGNGRNGRRIVFSGDSRIRKKDLTQRTSRTQRTQGADLLTGEGEDHQVAFAGGNYGEEAAVGRNGEFAERYAMEE